MVEKFFEEKQEVILSFCFLFALDVPNSSRHFLLLYYLVCVCSFECSVMMLSTFGRPCVCHHFEKKVCSMFSVYYSIFFHNLKSWDVSHSHCYNKDTLGTCFLCVYVPHFVWVLFCVGQCLLLGLPLIVSGSSDCRIHFKLNRNVLTILVLTDWQTLLPFWPFTKHLYQNIFILKY